jgi:hypothetical protein
MPPLEPECFVRVTRQKTISCMFRSDICNVANNTDDIKTYY